MPVDYDAIREENIQRYGWDTAVLDLLGQLYSERTHFIFELVQNAEDAEATELTFRLYRDRLEVRHDGRPFNEADVRGICGVGKSAKSDDLTQIGKFGIGFKSVYAYTRTPQVHSGQEHFRIEKYVRPSLAEEVTVPDRQTLFVFPFDHEHASRRAVGEISSALNALSLSTLLFLRRIERIQISGIQTPDTLLERVATHRTPTCRHVELKKATEETREREEWFVWHCDLSELDQPSHRVELAFPVESKDGQKRLVGRTPSPLVVFFPTEKETFLNFLIQGPYRTTPARDNVPEHDLWNQQLVHETAQLLTHALKELRQEDLLTVDVLQAMPLDASRFQPGCMFRPLFEAVRGALLCEELIPLTGGGYGSAAQLKLARGAGLRDLLPPPLLQELYGLERLPAFAHESITVDRTPGLYRYLREEIGVDEVTPDAVLSRVTADLLAAQPDAWLGRFYGFIHSNPSLWRLPRHGLQQAGQARSKPILRLEDGAHVAPFDSRGDAVVYLPGSTETEFPTVRRAVAALPEARTFLEALGLHEPDVVAEVLELILPRYTSADAASLNPAQHLADLERIARALADAAFDRRHHLREVLRRTAFVIGRNAATSEARLWAPRSLYSRSPELTVYFGGNPLVWFLADGYEPWLAELRDLGVNDQVKVVARAANRLGQVVTVQEHGRHERGLDGFDPDATIDGLGFALRHPTEARSEYVWNVLLAPHRHLVVGIVERSGRRDFSNAIREEGRSPTGTAATEHSWLPGADSVFRRPEELELGDLPEGYKRDETLARALGMAQRTDIDEVSRQLGLPAHLLQAMQEDPDLVREFLQARAARAETARDDGPTDDEDALEPVDFVTELAEAFARPGSTRASNMPAEVASAGTVSNPDFRRTRLRAAIGAELAAEPTVGERFHRVPRRIWEAKDSAVRHFLLEQYEGQCQICTTTFLKRNGSPYFEGLYLVGRTKGRWIDRAGNVLCLCATCAARFQFGPVEAPDILDQIRNWRAEREGGGSAVLALRLGDEEVKLRFTEKHLLELQELVAAQQRAV